MWREINVEFLAGLYGLLRRLTFFINVKSEGFHFERQLVGVRAEIVLSKRASAYISFAYKYNVAKFPLIGRFAILGVLQ
jgi:hypothetical protein